MKTLKLTTILLLSILILKAQTIIPLYPSGKIPNSIAVQDTEVKKVSAGGTIVYSKVSVPTLEIYLPEKDKGTGTAVVVCPGGGYSTLQYTREGVAIAIQFAKMGVAAFVLKYRLPSDVWMQDKSIGPLQDAQQAIKTIRMRATEWGVDTAKVGIIGFSAGGHLAATAETHFNKAVIDNKEGTNLRPAFAILIYPVISLTDSLAHKGSRNNLLGVKATDAMVNLYSNDMQVTKSTPPTFIAHAGDDRTVKVANSVNMYTALQQQGVPAELHVYPTGGHGFSGKGSEAAHWMDRCRDWMRFNKWIQ